MKMFNTNLDKYKFYIPCVTTKGIFLFKTYEEAKKYLFDHGMLQIGNNYFFSQGIIEMTEKIEIIDQDNSRILTKFAGKIGYIIKGHKPYFMFMSIGSGRPLKIGKKTYMTNGSEWKIIK